jgi:hypothetical protein
VLCGLALFALGQAALAVQVLGGGLWVRDPNFAAKRARLQGRLARPAGAEKPALVVQVGSSRTVFGLRGQEAEPWLARRLGRPVVLFNMGFYGSGSINNLLTVNRLFEQGIRPDLLLLEVLPVNLGEHLRTYQLDEVRLPAHPLTPAEVRLLSRYAPDDRDVEAEWLSGLLVPGHTHRLSLLSSFVPGLLKAGIRQDEFASMDDSGWVPAHRVGAAASARALAQAKVATDWPAHVRIWPAALEAIRATLALARREGVPAALVLMPEGPLYRSWYEPVVWERIEAALDELARDCGVPLLSCREVVAEEGFLDSHHLLPEGAAAFTRHLACRIEPLLRNPPAR